MEAIAKKIFSDENLRFILCAIFGAVVSYVGLWHQVKENREKINNQTEINLEIKTTLKEINKDVLDIKLLLAKRLGG